MPLITDGPRKRRTLRKIVVVPAAGFARKLALAGSVSAVGAAVAISPASAVADSAAPITCSTPAPVSQAFAGFGDNNLYSAPGGESLDNQGFIGASPNSTGWTLSGGASFMTVQLYGGLGSGTVLDLPSGSSAVSPPMCISSAYPTARTMVQNAVGSEGVFFYVSYYGTSSWDNPKNTGQVHGNGTSWTLSDPVNVQPSNVPGYQIVKFTFIPGGNHSDFRVYNFFVDPYAKR